MSTATDIRDRRGIVEIDADNVTVARVRRQHFAQRPLSPGDEIDVQTYIDRIAAIQFADGYEAALTSLDYSARTAREISDSLRRRGFVPQVVEAVVAKLTENGLIDDARYAMRVAELQKNRPVGIYAMKRRLRTKGISDVDAEAALEAFDDDQQRDAALEAARSLYRKYQSLPPREGRAKLSQALARRGFSWDAIDSALEQLFE